MSQLTIQQRTFLVKTFEQTRSYDQVLLEFQRRFPGRPLPHKKRISWNERKFSRTGTVRNLHKERCGKKKIIGRSAGNINVVTNVVGQNLNVSCRNNPTGIPSATFNRIVRLDLKWHLFKHFVRHELKAGDFGRRVQFVQWFLNACRNLRFIYNLVIGDECSFRLNDQRKMYEFTLRRDSQQPFIMTNGMTVVIK